MDKSCTILRNNIDITINAKCDAFELNNAIREWYYESFLPLLNKTLDQIDSTDFLLMIDELNIDLEMEYHTSFLKGMEKKLIENILQQISSGSTNNEKGQNIKKLPSLNHFWDTFIFYLENGFLPWQRTLSSGQGLQVELSQKFEKIEREEIKKLRKALYQKEASKRFVNLAFSNPGFESMIGMISGNMAEFGPSSFLHADLAKLSELINLNATPIEKSSGSNSIAVEKTIYQKLLTLISKQNHGVSSITILQDLLPEYLSQLETPKSEHIEIDFNCEAVKAVIENTISTKNEYQANAKNNSGTENNVPTIGKEEDSNALSEEKNDEALLNKKVEEAAKDGIFINNAGLIIAAPFLPTLFEKTGLLTEGKLNNPDTAIALCYYLLKGHSNFTEFELALIKILCGVPLNQAVSFDSELSEEMRHEANELLNAILTHWQVLKGTSIGGLREAFFYRNGKIISDYNSWHLRVEQKPYDMLLQQLPWNITMIKFSWMEKALMTEWA